MCAKRNKRINELPLGTTGATNGQVAVYNPTNGLTEQIGIQEAVEGGAKDSVLYKSTITPNPAHQEGLTFYDFTKKALSYYNDEPQTTINLGQELVIKVINSSAEALNNGTVVRVKQDAVNSLPSVEKALADTSSNARSSGVVTHDIAPGATGYVTLVGQVGGLNLSAYTEGQIVYLSDTTPGELTGNEPRIIVTVGQVLDNSATDGQLYVIFGRAVNITAFGQARGNGNTQSLNTTPTLLSVFDPVVPEVTKNVNIDQNAGAGSAQTAEFQPASPGASGYYDLTLNAAISGTSNNPHRLEFYYFDQSAGGGSGAWIASGVYGEVDLSNNQTDTGTITAVGIPQFLVTEEDRVSVFGYTTSGTSSVTFNSIIFKGVRISTV